MEFGESPFCEGFLNCLKIYLRESEEVAIVPVSVSKESLEVWVIIEYLADCCALTIATIPRSSIPRG